MLMPVLVVTIIALGILVIYLYVVSPKLNPNFKAERLVKDNRLEDAVAEYGKMIEKFPLDISNHYKISQIFMSLKRFPDAIEHLERIVEINVYNNDIKKLDVLRLLAGLYRNQNDEGKTFEAYYIILQDSPTDLEALYHTGFIALGQEMFDFAFKQLENYARWETGRFDVHFGAGIAALQIQKLGDATSFFKKALGLNSRSDIGNIAMSYALYKKRDFKTATKFAKVVVDSSSDENAVFIAKRILGIIFVEIKKFSMAIKLLEELKEMAIEKNWQDEHETVLYDLGFVHLMEEKTELAYSTWEMLHSLNSGHLNIEDLLTRLRYEMDSTSLSSGEIQSSVINEVERWKTSVLPANFIWRICGLRSSRSVDLGSIIEKNSNLSSPIQGKEKVFGKVEIDPNENFLERLSNIDILYKLEPEAFRSVAYRVTEKLGLSIDEILKTYRERDGVDFIAKPPKGRGKGKVLVYFRRWEGATLGEIPLRNFAQDINDFNASSGFFITSAKLSESGESTLHSLSKVTFVGPEELETLLNGLL